MSARVISCLVFVCLVAGEWNYFYLEKYKHGAERQNQMILGGEGGGVGAVVEDGVVFTAGLCVSFLIQFPCLEMFRMNWNRFLLEKDRFDGKKDLKDRFLLRKWY